MAYLLDSHAALWAFERGSTRLSSRARELILSAPVPIFVSAVSAYELEYKAAIGKLAPLPLNFGNLAAEAGFRELPLTIAHAELAARFASTHRDPWDRLIAAQALHERYHVVTRDRAIAKLGVQTIW